MRKRWFTGLVRWLPNSNISLLPFLTELKRYRVSFIYEDLQAAISVALLTIPQSIAYALLAGLPTSAGLFSAIFGSILVAGFGSSRYLIAGPSTGVAILIQTSISQILSTYYPSVQGLAREALVLQILTHIVLLTGILHFLATFLRFSKVLQFVSKPVVLGYFSGVAIAIIVNQLFYFLGIPLGTEEVLLLRAGHLFSHLHQIDILSAGIGIFTLGSSIYLRSRYPKIPSSFLLLIAGILFSYFCSGGFSPCKLSIISLGDVGSEAFPSFHFILPSLSWNLLNIVFPSAVAIAFLAVLEVISISRELGAKSGEYVQSNQELFGLGIGNLFLSFLYGAMPASGSLARSTLNFHSKAKSRFAAIFSGLLVAITIFFFWPFVRHVPLAVLAGLLLAAIPSIVHFEQIALALRVTRGDLWAYFLTMISCLLFSLDVAFFIGIAISLAFFLKKAAVPHLVEYAFNPAGRLIVVNAKSIIRRKIRIIGVGGELFFAAVDLFQNALQTVAEDPNVQAIILRLQGVHHMDASMCFAILRLDEYLQATGRHLIISGISEEVWQVFFRAEIVEKVGEERLFLANETDPQLSTWRACQRAQELIEDWDE